MTSVTDGTSEAFAVISWTSNNERTSYPPEEFLKLQQHIAGHVNQ